MAKARVKKGDMVVVISGKDRDLTTPRRVLQVDPSRNRVLVEGVNIVKRHTRPNPQRNNQGGIVERESMIHLSNVMPLDPDSKKRTRVGAKILEDGTRARTAKRSGTMLDT
jgi:large subunit ribosomal protein L24